VSEGGGVEREIENQAPTSGGPDAGLDPRTSEAKGRHLTY